MDITKDEQPRNGRRTFLKKSLLTVGALTTGSITNSIVIVSAKAKRSTGQLKLSNLSEHNPTTFIHACMTLPYRNYSLERALSGIKEAGYDHVAWGTRHKDNDGENYPVLAETASPNKAAELADQCRDMGLEPVQMFSTIYPDQDDAVELLTNRIKQASAADVKNILVFGPTDGGDPDLWVSRFNKLAPIAADYGVTFLLKQHGGDTTGTGKAIKKIIQEINHPNIEMSYDAGNILWYQDVDPILDIRTCADLISGFCLKDCRYWPTKTTSAPGFGEIDHYKLFEPVANNGKTITLTYENIYPSYLGQPSTAEEIDKMASQAKFFVENVIAGVQKTVAEG